MCSSAYTGLDSLLGSFYKQAPSRSMILQSPETVFCTKTTCYAGMTSALAL